MSSIKLTGYKKHQTKKLHETHFTEIIGKGWTSCSSWWFQPIWKMCSTNWIISPGIRVKIKKVFELPPPRCCLSGGSSFSDGKLLISDWDRSHPLDFSSSTLGFFWFRFGMGEWYSCNRNKTIIIKDDNKITTQKSTNHVWNDDVEPFFWLVIKASCHQIRYDHWGNHAPSISNLKRQIKQMYLFNALSYFLKDYD